MMRIVKRSYLMEDWKSNALWGTSRNLLDPSVGERELGVRRG